MNSVLCVLSQILFVFSLSSAVRKDLSDLPVQRRLRLHSGQLHSSLSCLLGIQAKCSHPPWPSASLPMNA